jgi:hypothetical protein
MLILLVPGVLMGGSATPDSDVRVPTLPIMGVGQ